jgi:hypothetical protein
MGRFGLVYLYLDGRLRPVRIKVPAEEAAHQYPDAMYHVMSREIAEDISWMTLTGRIS